MIELSVISYIGLGEEANYLTLLHTHTEKGLWLCVNKSCPQAK